MIQFAVTLKEGEWTVFRDGEVLARGMSRSRAVEQAHDLADEAREAGRAVELLLQDYVGELRSWRTE
ncbi:MAG TPA: hypothetical protein VGG29_12415 [Caulobacteraceae bacterium]|jgi:hypothetical protein